MPRLLPLSRYRPVEGTARAKRLSATHAMHANAAGLATFGDDLITLRTSHVLYKYPVTAAKVRGDVFAFSFELPVHSAQWLSILASLIDLPQPAIGRTQLVLSVRWSQSIA